MIEAYAAAARDALTGVLSLLTGIALPLAICAGLVAIAAALRAALLPESAVRRATGERNAARVFGYALAGLLVVTGWAALRALQPQARQAIQWRESAEATANPIPDAPAVYQFGPSLAALVERTYTRTLTLPPDFLQRIGSEGVGVLAPYLTDPTAENVLRLVDTFRRSGQDVVFTREMTRLDEDPLPFTTSNIRLSFRRLPGRAYEADFEGRYTFRNPGAQPINARFLFPLPNSGTLRDLSITVGEQAVTEQDRSDAYRWEQPLAPGQSKEAVVRYRVIGARTWNYDLGSRRRRVQQFRLDAVTNGPVRFLRGSLQPTGRGGNSLRWELANVITAQQVALSFLPDTEGRDAYLQALSALPVAFILFLVGVLAVGAWFRHVPGPVALAAGLALFLFGLGASAVLANYLGFIAGILIGPLIGALLAVGALGRRFLLASLPAALLPAAFLSPRHSGLLVLLPALAVAAATLWGARSRRPPAAGDTGVAAAGGEPVE